MVFATKITLIPEEPHGVFDSIGTATRDVYAEIADVGMHEYYQARSAGLAPEIAFEIPYFLDYKGEKLLTYNNKKYRIIRTTTRNNQRVRLICERAEVNDV